MVLLENELSPMNIAEDQAKRDLERLHAKLGFNDVDDIANHGKKDAPAKKTDPKPTGGAETTKGGADTTKRVKPAAAAGATKRGVKA